MSNGCMEKARAAWGARLPEWVATLAAACDKTSQSRTAQDLGVNPGYVSWVLGAKNPQYHASVEAAVRGRLMAVSVRCPVLMADLRMDRCAELASGRARGVSPMLRWRLERNCPFCLHRSGGPS